MIHHQSCFTNSKILTRLSAILLLAVCSLTVDTVKADLITVTIEAPTVQQSALATNPGLFGATGVHVENFDSLTSGPNPFAGNPAIGNYNSGNIVNADPVGGAGGTGKYVTFGEDQSRIRKGNADSNFSTLRRTALSLLRREGKAKVGIKNKRLIAGWDDNYMTQVLFGN